MTYFEAAREVCPGITPQGFMKALYAPALGLAPPRDVDEVLEHLREVPQLADRDQGVRADRGVLSTGVGAARVGPGLRVTQNHTIHAGRSDDPKVWTATKVLAMECTPQGVLKCKVAPACCSAHQCFANDALGNQPHATCSGWLCGSCR